jgi:A/G-specific adenine glycosylase
MEFLDTQKRKKLAELRKTIKVFARTHTRSFPWRQTTDPYHILVSELMLQQTQTARVVPKYEAFLKAFPTTRKLSVAPLSDVLRLWQGLGYNRRARFLQESARVMAKDGVPKTIEEFEALPGVGHYTARAVCAFAYNTHSLFFETNIRTVLIHHFFQKQEKVSDKDLLPYLEALIDKKEARFWYTVLMDYGAHLKTVQKSTGDRQSKGYKKQKPLKGSVREVRGEIIKLLTENKSISLSGLEKKYINDARLSKAIEGLQKDGLVVVEKKKVRLMM